MRRVLLDIGVIVSALISRDGPPAALLERWHDGEFEVEISEAWLEEFDDVFVRPHLAKRMGDGAAADLRASLAAHALLVPDQPLFPGATPDPDDDYLVALAEANRCDVLVSGDSDLLGLERSRVPVLSPRKFLDLLEEQA